MLAEDQKLFMCFSVPHCSIRYKTLGLAFARMFASPVSVVFML